MVCMFSRLYTLEYAGTKLGYVGHTRLDSLVGYTQSIVFSRLYTLGYPGTKPGYVDHTWVVTLVGCIWSTYAYPGR